MKGKSKWKVRLTLDGVPETEVEAENIITTEGGNWVKFYTDGKEVACFARERVVAVLKKIGE